jgi:hypothetical protein
MNGWLSTEIGQFPPLALKIMNRWFNTEIEK